MIIWNKFLKFIAIALAVTQPFIFISLYGELNSISQYWTTMGQPLFIITNAMTSYFLFSTRYWQIPALCLLGLTACSVSLYPSLHNVFAVSFFVTALIPMIRVRRFKWYLIPYILAGIWTVFNMLYGEIAAIMVICAYHTHIMLYVYFYKKRHKNLDL